MVRVKVILLQFCISYNFAFQLSYKPVRSCAPTVNSAPTADEADDEDEIGEADPLTLAESGADVAGPSTSAQR